MSARNRSPKITASTPRRRKCVVHLQLIIGVARAFWNQDLEQWKPEGSCLTLEKLPAHAMHADASIVARDRRQQRVDVTSAATQDFVQRETAVLSAAPRNQRAF
jgi:hypothetical protein